MTIECSYFRVCSQVIIDIGRHNTLAHVLEGAFYIGPLFLKYLDISLLLL